MRHNFLTSFHFTAFPSHISAHPYRRPHALKACTTWTTVNSKKGEGGKASIIDGKTKTAPGKPYLFPFL